MAQLKNITLEMSLKPFRQTDDDAVKGICRQAFAQWNNLVKQADRVSVLLWSSDGSEILDYRGEPEETFDWARYLGGVNPRKKWNKELDPEGIGLHTRSYLYMENPPVWTYRMLKNIVRIIKDVGREMTGKPVRVGATFDPGPEFARSDFKYQRHAEICLGNTYGDGSFVCCYAALHEDRAAYAGFLEGIPEGTPFGTFFGRQCRHFLEDLDFDFLWLSNGFGFGCENWGITGALFDGKRFNDDNVDEIKEKIIGFWKLFRKECPDFRIETRGTNLTAGVDLATDGVPLRDLYRGNFNLLPPPNSPWAALNRDFGLEIAGYMSRIAELPEKDFMFRFYVHDPWWMNSPWIDRYEGQPYDIYLPLAVSRIDEDGKVQSPSYINFLTIDNTLGEMPDRCPNEIIPHILHAYGHLPDAASPFIWLYPFAEYHEMVSGKLGRLEEVFFGDWFLRGAVNQGLPVSTVVSTGNFIRTRKVKPELYRGSVLITPVPLQDSEFEKEILRVIKSGGKVLLYGPLDNAGDTLLDALNLAVDSPVDGILEVVLHLRNDDFTDRPYPQQINHRRLISGGGIGTVLKDAEDQHTEVLMHVAAPAGRRIACVYRKEPEWNGGEVVWLRGTNAGYYKEGEWLLLPDDPDEYFHTENMMRLALEKFGYAIGYIKRSPSDKSPVIMIHRNNHAFYFSGYMPDTTVALRMRFPLGAPVLVGAEVELKAGCSLYRMPRAWHMECRVFAVQAGEAVLSCTEYPPVSHSMGRRLRILGLKGTTLRIFPERGCEDTTEVLLNSRPEDHLTGEPMACEIKDSPWGKYIEAVKVTGEIMIATPFRKKVAF